MTRASQIARAAQPRQTKDARRRGFYSRLAIVAGAALVFCLLLCLAASAEHTRRWRQSSYDEFVKGTAHGVAVRSDGRLELAPKFTLLGGCGRVVFVVAARGAERQPVCCGRLAGSRFSF